MALDKLSGNSFATGAIANSLGYTPANKAGDTFTGAVTVSNTMSIGNTTITGFANVTSTFQVGTSVYLNNSITTAYNNNNNTLYGNQNIGLVGQWSTINWPINHAAANTTTPWFMLGRVSGDTVWKLGIRSGWNGSTGGNDTNAWVVTPGGSNTAATIDSQVWNTSSGTMALVANGNVGIKTSTPTAVLDVGGAPNSTIGTQAGFFSGAKAGYASIQSLPQNQLAVYDTTQNAAGSGGAISLMADCGSGQQTWLAAIEARRDSATAGNYGGSLNFYTRPNGSYYTAPVATIDSNGYTMFKTKKVGMGTYTGNGKEVQMLSWTGTMTNGTIDLLTNVSFAENGHCGIFGINVTTSGKGVSRLYLLTGRYAQCTLTMQQGGNRGAGEDAYLSINGGSNSIGLQLTISGFSGSQPYYVWGIVGITTDRYDNWFSN